MMTSWHLPRPPLQKSGPARCCRPTPGSGTWPTSQPPAAPARRAAAGLRQTRLLSPLGRETGIARIEWRDGWPYVEGGKHAQLTVKGPQMAEQPASVQGNWRGGLTAVRLTRNCRPCASRSTTSRLLTARPGYLRLYSNDSLSSAFTQSTVARRWQHFVFRSGADAVLASSLPSKAQG